MLGKNSLMFLTPLSAFVYIFILQPASAPKESAPEQEDVPNVYVPPLSIQPLVENALVHGFRDKEAEGKITISITPYKDYCHIDVSDNGNGISEEMLQGLPASFAQTAHIGLYNIEKRLMSKFHTGLVIQSEEGLGTSISFTVPPEGKYDDLRSEVTA